MGHASEPCGVVNMQNIISRKKSVFITGASSGIGAAIACDLAKHGYNLALVARRSELLDMVARDCISHGAEVLQFQIDLAERTDEHLKAAIENAAAKFGGLDSLIMACRKRPISKYFSVTDLVPKIWPNYRNT